MAKLFYETSDCRARGECFVHLGINGVDDLFSALLVAGCAAAGEHALQHDVGCDKAGCVIDKPLCQAEEPLDELW